MFLQTISSGSQISLLSGNSWRRAHQWVHRVKAVFFFFSLWADQNWIWSAVLPRSHCTLWDPPQTALHLTLASFYIAFSLFICFPEEICKKGWIKRRGQISICPSSEPAHRYWWFSSYSEWTITPPEGFSQRHRQLCKIAVPASFSHAGCRSLQLPAEQLSIWAYLACRIPVGKALLNSHIAKQSNAFVCLFVCDDLCCD